MEVESKFNPDDWNGYLHTYETIEEYNAARKLLPHTARIESTREAKYIPREELSVRFLYLGNINRSSWGTISNSNEFDDYLEDVENNDIVYQVTKWEYIFVGKVEYGEKICYLWELNRYDDDYIGIPSPESRHRRYALTEVVEPKFYYSTDQKVYRAKLLTEDNFEVYSRGGDANWKTAIDGNTISEIIFCISDYALS